MQKGHEELQHSVSEVRESLENILSSYIINNYQNKHKEKGKKIRQYKLNHKRRQENIRS